MHRKGNKWVLKMKENTASVIFFYKANGSRNSVESMSY